MNPTEELRKQLCPLGFISPFTCKASSGNGQLYSAYALVAQNFIPEETLIAIDECEVEEGLLLVAKGDDRQQSQDNLIGLAVFCQAPLILRYLRKHRYVYRTKSGTSWIKCFMGRYPALIAHLMYCSAELPPLWLRLWWAAALVTSTLRKDQDSRMLAEVFVYGARFEMGSIERAAVYLWKRLERRSLVQTVRAYFGWEHPLVNWQSEAFKK